MKEPYVWDYNIKIKTSEGVFEYEKETLENIELLLAKHPDYTEIRASQNKPKTLAKKPIQKGGNTNGNNKR